MIIKELIPYIKLEEGEMEFELKSVKKINERYQNLFPNARSIEEFIKKFSISKKEINDITDSQKSNLVEFIKNIYHKHKAKVFQSNYEGLINTAFPNSPVSCTDCFESNRTAAYFELFGIEKISWENLEGLYYVAFAFDNTHDTEPKKKFKRHFLKFEEFPQLNEIIDEKKVTHPINLLLLINGNYRSKITKYMVNNYSRIKKNNSNISKIKKEFEEIKNYDGETSIYRKKVQSV